MPSRFARGFRPGLANYPCIHKPAPYCRRMDTNTNVPRKTFDMAAYKRAWKAANPDKVKAHNAKHARKRATAAWKRANADKVASLRAWKAAWQRRKRAEAKTQAAG